MELINTTGLCAAWNLGMDKHARESLVVVVKGTFTLPLAGGEPRLAAGQQPPLESDVFTGEPGLSAPRYESDFAPLKRRCDVLLNGSAYAPGGQPATAVDVGIRLGRVSKIFTVAGSRRWRAVGDDIGMTAPQAFTVKPVGYDLAFGGVDNGHEDPARHDACYANPVGRGFHRELDAGLIDGTPLPNTQERGAPVLRPDGDYRPMAFGPVGRHWQPRSRLAGTYDQRWLDAVFPFLPEDFDEGYYQCAPPDQQTDFLQGGEEVLLYNLTPQGRTVFRLPPLDVPVVFFPRRGPQQERQAMADTLMLEPDRGLFTVTWRASLPLADSLFEIAQVLVGRASRGWWRARRAGKAHHPSLAGVVRAARVVAEEGLDE